LYCRTRLRQAQGGGRELRGRTSKTACDAVTEEGAGGTKPNTVVAEAVVVVCFLGCLVCCRLVALVALSLATIGVTETVDPRLGPRVSEKGSSFCGRQTEHPSAERVIGHSQAGFLWIGAVNPFLPHSFGAGVIKIGRAATNTLVTHGPSVSQVKKKKKTRSLSKTKLIIYFHCKFIADFHAEKAQAVQL